MKSRCIVESSRVLVACAALQALLACNDDKSPSAPGTGSVRVTVATTGVDPDPDGYAVSVDNGQAQAVPANGSITVARVAAGSRSVTLTGLAANCTVANATQTVGVTAGAEASVTFAVTCVAAQAGLQVTVATTGDAPDPDGYSVSVDGGAAQPIPVNGTVSFPPLAAGTHSVTLAGLAAGCIVNGENPRSVSVTAGSPASVSFEVVCSAATGSIQVSVTTSGSDVDASGYLVTVDGGATATVATNGTVGFASVGPGDHTVQLSDIGANCTVADNPRTVTVVAGAAAVADFVVTCTAARIVFVSTRDGNYDLYTINPDGSAVQRLTSTTDVTEDAPAWSPDYSRIAFARSDGADGYDIYVMNADGSDVTRLTNATGDDNFPAWSRDGTKIAFTSGRDGNDEIYVMNADGTGQVNVTNNAAKDQVPAWSPDGARLAFQSDRDAATGRFEIYTVRPDGSELTKIVSSPAGDFHPTYSPDGLRLLFASSRDDPQREIYVVNVDGAGVQRLTTNPAEDNWPTWSPDGTRIAFYSTRDGGSEIYTMDASGAGMTRITTQVGEDIRPAWRP